MKIIIGADHRGYACKEHIKQVLSQYEWIDVGADTNERSDYPVFAHDAMNQMKVNNANHAILLCGSGIGMAIVANRYKNIRAGVVWNASITRQAKEHDNVNVLVIPCDYVLNEEVIVMITTWMSVDFLGGRYQDRLAMIEQK